MITQASAPTRLSTESPGPQRPRGLSRAPSRPRRLAALRRRLEATYYYATYPGRSWYVRRLAAAGRAPIAVLAFHRIADDRASRWTMRTSDFVKTIRWLKQRFEFLSLAELQRRVDSGFNSRPGVCITFDDGYADNCRVALPLLVEQRIPCTYFVTTDAVLEGEPFIHDVEMGNRHLAPNSIAELRHWSRSGIDIGAHTRTHANLGLVTDRRLLIDELVTPREELEAALQCEIRYFAFPFGSPENLTAEAFQVAHEAGYAGVCSAYGRWNHPAGDSFHIRRRCVDGPPTRAKNWAVFDPLRERMLPDYHVGAATILSPRKERTDENRAC